MEKRNKSDIQTDDRRQFEFNNLKNERIDGRDLRRYNPNFKSDNDHHAAFRKT
jgi:hypothetical protein